MRGKSFEFILTGLILSLFVIAWFFPALWAITSSFKAPVEMFSIPPTLIPKAPTLGNYVDILTVRPFTPFMVNSILVALITILITFVVGTPAAYSFARYKFKGSNTLFFFFLVTRMIPSMSLVIPLYLVMRQFNLSNTIWALVLAYISFLLPFIIWMMRGFFLEIPREIEEAALIDGCSPLGAFARMTLPLSAPGLIATMIFAFIFSWNEFLFALLLAPSPASKTMPLALAEQVTPWEMVWGRLFAGAVIYIIPVIIFVVFVQRYLVSAPSAGAIKS